VATHRPLVPLAPTVRAVSGDIDALVATARAAAGARDVYLDGADLVRQALDARLVDAMTITFVPVLLGAGVRLFEGLLARHALTFRSHHRLGRDLVQLTVDVTRG